MFESVFPMCSHRADCLKDRSDQPARAHHGYAGCRSQGSTPVLKELDHTSTSNERVARGRIAPTQTQLRLARESAERLIRASLHRSAIVGEARRAGLRTSDLLLVDAPYLTAHAVASVLAARPFTIAPGPTLVEAMLQRALKHNGQSEDAANLLLAPCQPLSRQEVGALVENIVAARNGGGR